MKKGLLVLTVILGIGVGGYALAHNWGGGYGGHMMRPGYGGWGHMMGYGGPMMGSGYGYCWGQTGTGEALTQKDAKAIAKNYIGPNPNLKVGKIEEREDRFEAEIVTKDDSLVTKLGIHKETGWTRPIY